MKKFLITMLFGFSITIAMAQDYDEFYKKSNGINNNAMLVLGSWATANLVSGAIGWRKSTSNQKYFHQMNFMWNTVNLGIAGFALYNNLKLDINSLSNYDLLQRHLKSENLYLINSAIDIAYISTGILMWHFHENSKKPNLVKGYGQSIILQGSFLFVFDLIVWGIQKNHRINFMENIHLSEAGIGLRFII